MIELVSGGLALLWGLCVLSRGLAGEMCKILHRWRPLTNSTPRGLEYRHIGRLGGRVVAVRLQLVIA